MKKAIGIGLVGLAIALALPAVAKTNNGQNGEHPWASVSPRPSVSPKGDEDRSPRALCQVQAKNAFRTAEKTARDVYLAAKKAAREQFKTAKDAAQSKDARKAAEKAFKDADKAAKLAFKNAELTARDAFKKAKEGCKLIKPTPSVTPAVTQTVIPTATP